MMKHAKQLLLLAFLFTIGLLLNACSPRTQSIHFQKFYRTNELDRRVTLYYQEDRLLKSKTTTTTLYSFIGVKNAEAAKRIVGDKSETFKDMAGYTVTQDFQDDRYVEVFEIDYEKIDLSHDYNTYFERFLSDDGKSLSFKKFKESMPSSDYIVIEDNKFQELPK